MKVVIEDTIRHYVTLARPALPGHLEGKMERGHFLVDLDPELVEMHKNGESVQLLLLAMMVKEKLG